ncbi:MAG: T9SS type A sorting domain-containing protein [Ignavibacteria bacterium]|nr:T9SS type A sorting domain-containing protein [Ignavibacteria bacterium]
MKRFTLLTLFSIFIITAFSVNKLNAQGFTFTPLGSTFVQLPYLADSTQVVKHQAIVRNTSASTLNFKFARISNILASGFETQMCYDLCYAPSVDTISLPGDPPYSIAPNHVDTMFYIDFTCIGQGLGTSIVRMYNTSNASLYVQDTFKVQIGNVGISPISTIAEDYNLSQNYPNPFNPVTNINFSISRSEILSLKVYDLLGNEVANLVNNEKLATGKYKIEFYGNNFSSGIYYYTLRTNNFSDTKKMILLK